METANRVLGKAVLLLGVTLAAGFGQSAELAKVGVFTGPGATGVGVARWLQIVASSPELDVVCVEDAAELDGLDLLVVPEGDAARMAAAFGSDGAARLKALVAHGGACIGSGAGSRVLIQGESGFGLVPFAARQPETPRNATLLRTEVTAAGAARLGVKAEHRRVWYDCGPCLVPGTPIEGASFVTAAKFRGNINPVNREHAPTMTGTASMVAGTYGKGRALVVADNPEYNVDTFDLVRGMLGWTLGRKVSFSLAQRRRGQLSAGFYCGGAIGAAAARAFVELVRSGVADLELIDGGRLEEGRLRHLDALVVPEGVAVSGAQVEEFVRRGGRILPPEGAVAALRAATPERRKIARAAVYADRGVSCAEFWNVSKLLSCSPNYDVTFVDRHDISNNVVNVCDFDLLLMSGGPIGVQEQVVGASGRAAVTNFVRQGGAFYGICAGTFSMLQSSPKHPRFALIPFRNMPNQPYRGWCEMTMRFTADATELLGIPADTRRTVLYWGGPVMVPAEVPADSDIRVLAAYEGNVVNIFTGGDIRPMAGCASIVGGRFGKGRVIASAIHPECSEATRDLVCGFLRYLTGREARPAYPAHEPGAVKVAFCMETATKAGLAFGMSLVRDARFDVRPVTPYEVGQGLLDNTDVLFFPWPVPQGYMGLVNLFVRQGGSVIELDPEGKGSVRGERVHHVRTFDEARRIMLAGSAPAGVGAIAFANPVIARDWPDPSVWSDGAGGYCSVATRLDTLMRSPDLVHWTDTKTSPITPEARAELEKVSRNIWAPCVVKVGSSWNLYVSLFVSDAKCKIAVLTASAPTGPFAYRGIVIDSVREQVLNAIDPYVLEADGKVLMFFGSLADGVHVVELTADGLGVAPGAKPRHVAGVRRPPSKMKGAYEGSYVMKRGAWWYLFVSGGNYANHTYYLTVGRAAAVTGPYLDREGHPLTEGLAKPILASGADERFYGPGHNGDVFAGADGRTYVFYHSHCTDNPRRERPTLLQELKWTQDGWPFFADGRPAEQEVFRPDAPADFSRK